MLFLLGCGIVAPESLPAFEDRGRGPDEEPFVGSGRDARKAKRPSVQILVVWWKKTMGSLILPG
jgi:hypothetical protein